MVAHHVDSVCRKLSTQQLAKEMQKIVCTRPCVQWLVDSISVTWLCAVFALRTLTKWVGRIFFLFRSYAPTSTGRPNCCVFRSNSTPAAITVRDYSGRNLSKCSVDATRKHLSRHKLLLGFKTMKLQRRKCIFERTDPDTVGASPY